MKKYIPLYAITLIVVAMLLAGTSDYVQEVVYTMPANVYQSITAKIGKDASQADIVQEYERNRKYYDSLDTRYDK